MGTGNRSTGDILWGVETHRGSKTDASELEGRGKKEGLYRQEIGSEIDLVTWQYDLEI